MKPLRVLVACEFSGVVRRAWRERSGFFSGIANAMADQWGALAPMRVAA